MPNLVIKEQYLSEEVKNKISIALGWTPEVEDTEAELVGDEYPIIPNPISRDDFLSLAIVQEITSTIVRRGREVMVNQAKAQIDKINHGEFDNLIMG